MFTCTQFFFISLLSFIIPYIYATYYNLTLYGSHLIFALPFFAVITSAYISYSITVIANNIKASIEIFAEMYKDYKKDKITHQ